MRYTRLRRQIESGTLIGTHGTPFTGSAEKIFEASTKRKRGGGGVVKNQNTSDTEDEEPVQRKGRKSAEVGTAGVDAAVGRGKEMEVGRGRGGTKKGEVKVKEEPDSDFSSTESEFEDSEDEIPLAKLRKSRHGPRGGPAPSSSYKSYPPAASKTYVSPYPRMMTPGIGGSEVPRSMTAFGLGQGGDGFGRREDSRFGGLGSAFRSPVGRNEFVNGNGNGAGGWAEMDWARWQNRFENKEMNGSA
jgi:hypothetical protein